MTRRWRLGAVVCVLAITAAGCGGGSPSASSGGSKVVYINSSGGVLDDVVRQIMWDPFTKETGIKVINSAPVDNAKLKAMVDSGSTQWDITEVDDGDFVRDTNQGLLQKIDKSQLPMSDLPRDAVTDYGVWDGPYSTVLVWDTDKWPVSSKHPTSLMDLWNQTDFPGPRCMWKDAMDNLELAAQHAGISRSSVYPINQDQAYKELDKLKPHVGVWWTTGAQSVQSIVNHDCVMGTAWNGRPYQLVVQNNAHLAVAWPGAVLRVSWWAIPKGAAHKDAAMKLIAFMQDPKRQAQQAEKTGYSGPNQKTASFMSEAARQYLSTAPDHLSVTVVADDKWWSDNGPAAENRFTAWITS